jgi:hypothetical protein
MRIGRIITKNANRIATMIAMRAALTFSMVDVVQLVWRLSVIERVFLTG